MIMRAINRRAVCLVGSFALASPALAFESSGGPVRTTITLDGRRTFVDVNWVQSGGVVILKIVTADPVPEEDRDKVLAAAKKKLEGRPGMRAGYSQFGQLMLGFRLTGWTREFGEEDLKSGAAGDPGPRPSGADSPDPTPAPQ